MKAIDPLLASFWNCSSRNDIAIFFSSSLYHSFHTSLSLPLSLSHSLTLSLSSTLTHSLSISLTLTLAVIHTHTHSLSLSLSLCHSYSLSLSVIHTHHLSLYHIHTRTHFPMTVTRSKFKIAFKCLSNFFLPTFVLSKKNLRKRFFFLRVSSILKNIFFLKWRKLNEDLEILILEPHNLLSPTINSVFMEGGKCPGKKWWVWVSWVQIHDRDFFFKKSLLKHTFVIILVFIFDCPITLHLAWARFWGRHSTEVAFALLTQQPRVWILAQPWFYYTA